MLSRGTWKLDAVKTDKISKLGVYTLQIGLETAFIKDRTTEQTYPNRFHKAGFTGNVIAKDNKCNCSVDNFLVRTRPGTRGAGAARWRAVGAKTLPFEKEERKAADFTVTEIPRYAEK